MEVEVGFGCRDDANVAGHEPVEGKKESLGGDAGDVGVEIGHLAHRVHARIGAPGAERGNGMAVHAPQGLLELALHGASVALALPAAEGRSVVR